MIKKMVLYMEFRCTEKYNPYCMQQEHWNMGSLHILVSRDATNFFSVRNILCSPVTTQNNFNICDHDCQIDFCLKNSHEQIIHAVSSFLSV